MKRNYVYEEWKDIKGYEGLYQISNFGRVKSLKRNIILKTVKNHKGYVMVSLSKNSKIKLKTVHRIVAEAFIPNPLNYPQVNHKGENKSKNYVWQLEWCTNDYNAKYGTRNKRVADKLRKPVLQFDLNCEFIREWVSTIEIEREMNYYSGNIAKCCNGKYKTAYGYIWIYK